MVALSMERQRCRNHSRQACLCLLLSLLLLAPNGARALKGGTIASPVSDQSMSQRTMSKSKMSNKLPFQHPSTQRKPSKSNPRQMKKFYNDGPEWKPARFRVLVHCLQSSGCTYFMAILGQSANVLTALDVAINSGGVPRRVKDVVVRDEIPVHKEIDITWSNDNHSSNAIVVAKVPIWGADHQDPVHRLQQMKRKFKPHITILFVRHPVDNLASLNKHLQSKRTHEPGYALSHGDPVSKLRALEVLWKKRDVLFTEVIHYAELFLDRSNLVTRLKALELSDFNSNAPKGQASSQRLPITHCNFCCINAVRDIVADTRARLRFRISWGGGGINHLSPASEYRKGSRKSKLRREVEGASPETLIWSEQLEDYLSKRHRRKRKNEETLQKQNTELAIATGQNFISACQEAESSGFCAAQKQRVAYQNHKNSKLGVYEDLARISAVPHSDYRAKRKSRPMARFASISIALEALALPFSMSSAHLAGAGLIFAILAYLSSCSPRGNSR